MIRSRFACLSLAVAALASPLLGQQPVSQEPSDLQVLLRSATGFNRFQIGEVIPLEVVLSSSTPNRYLEPCVLFRESNFGFPQCRFFNRWSFIVAPESGWVDLTKEFPSGPAVGGGPTFEVPSRDLSSHPVVFSYLLTKRFRFDKPGEYRVRLSINVGLDDETTQRKSASGAADEQHAVTLMPELVLQIVPASAEWQLEIIRKGYAAYFGVRPRVTDPPSPELSQYQQATLALCNLGTPEAARVLAKLLSQDHSEVQECLQHTPSAAAAMEEMRRLLIDPDVAVQDDFFTVLVGLLSQNERIISGFPILSQEYVDNERERLFASLPKKNGKAQISSLLALLAHPPRSKGTPFEFGYDLPFAPPVIATVAANYDRFLRQSQEWLLDNAWDRVNSPLMLAVVRRSAEAGDGQALLRWLELDPAAATVFMRKEVVRPVPRFSSFYLRLPAASLPGQEKQIAMNFVALTQVQDLVRAATLLHRYATGTVLPVVLPFINAKQAEWPCSIQVPVLAYLLKVSPADAAPSVDQALQEANHGPCNTNTLFTDIGFLEPSPVLERLAMAQIEAGGPWARDAADYLRFYGSTAEKPFVWAQLVRWDERFVSSGAEKRVHAGAPTNDDGSQNILITSLADAFARAQAWVLSREDAERLEVLLGKEKISGLSCIFSCDASVGTKPSPGDYAIYASANEGWPQRGNRERMMEYLNPVERLHYSINQYRCPDMKALKDKLLQFPAGSNFNFAWEFTAHDRDELVEISDFLWSHGYKVRNPQKWDFLRLDPPK
jgi:hypothetical protein